MRIAVVAGAVSIGLHGFLLSQWPGPFVQTPRWTGTEPITVVYLAPEESSLSDRRELGVASRVGLDGPGEAIGPTPRPRSVAKPIGEQGRGSPSNSTSRAGTVSRLSGTSEARSVAMMGLAGAHQAVLGESRPTRADSWSTPTWLTPEAMATFRYRQTVRARLQRAIRYPAVLERSARGTVRLLVTIGRDGTLQAATCAEASAPAFEEAAMEGAGGAGPFPPIPNEVPDAPLVCEFLVAFVPGAEASINTLDGSRSPQ